MRRPSVRQGMRIELAEDLPGVPAERALEWWMDFQEGRRDHMFLPGARRRVLARSSAGAELEETVRVAGVTLFRERTRVRREGRSVRFEGRSTFADFEGAYRFEDEGRGARVRLDAQVRLRRPWAAPRWLVAAALRRDLRGHVRDLVRELRGATPP